METIRETAHFLTNLAMCGTRVVSMKCMRAVNLIISFSLFVSVEAFAGYGNFGTIVKTARDAQNAANVDQDPSHSQPAVWSGDCDGSGNIHKANLIAKNNLADSRRRLNSQEQVEASGVGFFHGAGSKGNFYGSGFAVENRNVLLTAAHNFAKDGEWLSYVKNPDGSLNVKGAQFYSDICKKSYPIKSIEVMTKNTTTDRDNDVGIVVLAEPLCEAAKPMPTQPVSDASLNNLLKRGEETKKPYISVVGFQWLERYENGASDSQTSTGGNSKEKKFGKLIDDGLLMRETESSLKKTVLMDASLLPGTSGGPVYGKFKGGKTPRGGVPAAIAVVVSELKDGSLNRARLIDAELDSKIQTIVRANP